MKKLLLLSCLFVLASCNEKPECDKAQGPSLKSTLDRPEAQKAENCPTPGPEPQPEPGPEPEPEPEPNPDPDGEVPHEALIFGAKFHLVNFEAEDEAKVTEAIEIIKKVVGTKEFKDRVINFTYNGKKQYVDNNGLSNEQIYKILLDGKEDLKPEIDHEMDLELELYYSWRSTVGYTYPDGLRIWMNTKFFDFYTPAEVAGNVFHEWTHKLGFDHAANYTVPRDSSVPYALGYLMEELGKKYE